MTVFKRPFHYIGTSVPNEYHHRTRTNFITERTFERQFLAQLELTPKQFSKIIQFKDAMQTGAKESFPAEDMDYGDRQGGIIDSARTYWFILKRLVEK